MSLKSLQRSHLWMVIPVLSGLGMFFVWLRQSNYGVGLDPDPVHLISIVDNLTQGEGLVAWDGRGFNPVFPLTVSIVISSLGIVDVFSASAYLNIIALGLSILIVVIWLSDKIAYRATIIFGGVACGFSPLLGNQHAMARTEPLFILFVIISLFALDRFFDNNKDRWIVLSAVFAALSILTRHMGISLIISTLILLAVRNRLSPQRLKCAVIYLAITMPIIVVYILRNFLRYGRLTERQWATGFSHSYSIDALVSELMSWTFTDIGFDYLERVSADLDISNMLIRIGMLVILIAFIGYGLVHFRHEKKLPKIGELATPIVFVLVYGFVLYFSLRISDIGSINLRYLSPIYIPVIVIIAVVLDKALSQISSRYILPFISLIGLWLTLLAIANNNAIKQWRDYGYDRSYYSSEDWINSETINYLKSNPLAGQIHSNDIRAVYVHMRIPNDAEAFFTVLPSYLPEDPLHWDWSRANNIDMYIVWFYGWKAYKAVPLDYDLGSLIASQDLRIIAVLEDGIILKDNQDYPLYSETLWAAILRDAQLIVADPMVDIYLDDERLIFKSTLCDGTNIDSPFFLHIYPIKSADIFEDRRNNNLNFNRYDFSFGREALFVGESCAVIRNLPNYDIKIIRTGQYTTSEGELWVEEFRPSLSYRQRTS